MGYRYWDGTKWVRITPDEAAVRRQRGDRVIERPDPSPTRQPVPARATPPPKLRAPARPPAKPPTPGPAAPRPAPTPPKAGAVSLDDLDESELEKLTAPGATSGG